MLSLDLSIFFMLVCMISGKANNTGQRDYGVEIAVTAVMGLI